MRLAGRSEKQPLRACLPLTPIPDAKPEVALQGKKTFPKVEDIVANHPRLNDALEALVKAGCDRAQLLTALDLVFLTDESWEGLLGMDLRAFKRAMKQIADCADTISRLENSELIWYVSVQARLPDFSATYEKPTLPERVRDFARRLQKLRSFYGPDHRPRYHIWKVHIVAMVLEATHRPHDPEVSELISAIRDDAKYSEKAHQKWRLENNELIEGHRERLRERRSHRVPPPPTPR